MWNYFTREVAPYEPIRRLLGLAVPRPLGPPPAAPSSERVEVSSPPPPPPPTGAAPPTAEQLQALDETLLCGWSELKGGLACEGQATAERSSHECAAGRASKYYFALSKGAQLQWFDCCDAPTEGSCLQLVDAINLRELSAIQREHPDSSTDFSFKIALQDSRSVVVDPGSGATYQQWEEGLLTAMSLAS